MPIKFLSIVTVAVLLAQPVFTETRQAKAGDVVALGDSVTIKVTTAAKSPFSGVKVSGEAFVVVLELDAGKKSARLGYKLSTDAAWSDIFLEGGEKRLGPRA